MATLQDYARQHFPEHHLGGDGVDVPLRPHTAVAHVIGSTRTQEVERQVRTTYPGDGQVATVLVRPENQTLTPTSNEDKEGIVDLPRKRLAASSLVAAAVVGLAVGLGLGFATDNVFIGVICGVFAALLAGWAGFLLGGGGRYAGERAWEQPTDRDRSIGLVAILLDDEHQANQAATLLSTLDPQDVRVVNERGAWHSPNTYSDIDIDSVRRDDAAGLS